MSSCCLMSDLIAAVPTAGPSGNAARAQAAAWSPNPGNPPDFSDPLMKDGQMQPTVAARWLANSPLVMVDQYVPALRSMRGIALDVGDRDGLAAANRQLHDALMRLDVAHTFDVYDGDHGSRIAQRFEAHVLPHFFRLLAAPTR
jgi:hypothetical protein